VVTQLSATPSEPARLRELLAAVQDSVRLLLSDVPSQPQRVHLRVGDVLVELEWPPGPSATPSAACPVSAGTAVQAADGTEDVRESTQRYIRAEMVGTFYHASEPGAKPFVVAGDLVEPEQQVGILEAMKLMTPVKAGLCGRIAEILVADGEAVEYGQPLLAVEPGTEE
jgi:acetyl-CoA carboxylase biotin carboxyl carrier protein